MPGGAEKNDQSLANSKCGQQTSSLRLPWDVGETSNLRPRICIFAGCSGHSQTQQSLRHPSSAAAWFWMPPSVPSAVASLPSPLPSHTLLHLHPGPSSPVSHGIPVAFSYRLRKQHFSHARDVSSLCLGCTDSWDRPLLMAL